VRQLTDGSQISLFCAYEPSVAKVAAAVHIGGSVRFAQIDDQSRCVSRGITPPRFRSPI
jgi:hypothetical protein